MPSILVVIIASIIVIDIILVINIIVAVIITCIMLLQVDAWCCSCAIHSSVCWAAFFARVTQVRKSPKFAV